LREIVGAYALPVDATSLIGLDESGGSGHMRRDDPEYFWLDDYHLQKMLV
jgi:hypothetical protein